MDNMETVNEAKKTKYPADVMQYDWHCCYNDIGKRDLLERELPDLYSY